MSEEEKKSSSTGGKSYHIGNVGAHAKVQQGEHLTMIEQAFAKTPEGDDLAQQFKALLEKIAEHPELDEDTRDLAMEKTTKVAEGLAKAKESPGTLRRALVDAKGWFSSAANWAWDEMSNILKSEAAQKTLATITEVGAKVAIKSLTGGI